MWEVCLRSFRAGVETITALDAMGAIANKGLLRTGMLYL